MIDRLPARVNGPLTREARELYKSLSLTVDIPKHVAIYVVNQNRGKAYTNKRMITIPVFAMNRDESYKLWYLSHELAHVADFDAGTYDHRKPHGPSFMCQLRRICPTDSQHWELGYKPRNAAAAGIRKPRK